MKVTNEYEALWKGSRQPEADAKLKLDAIAEAEHARIQRAGEAGMTATTAFLQAVEAARLDPALSAFGKVSAANRAAGEAQAGIGAMQAAVADAKQELARFHAVAPQLVKDAAGRWAARRAVEPTPLRIAQLQHVWKQIEAEDPIRVRARYLGELLRAEDERDGLLIEAVETYPGGRLLDPETRDAADQRRIDAAGLRERQQALEWQIGTLQHLAEKAQCIIASTVGVPSTVGVADS